MCVLEPDLGLVKTRPAADAFRSQDRFRPLLPQPSRKLAYFDKFNCWTHRPLTYAQVRAILNSLGGRDFHHPIMKAPFTGGFYQFISLERPTGETLQIIFDHDPAALINGIEIACDLIFTADRFAESAFALVAELFTWKGSDPRTYRNSFYSHPKPVATEPAERRVPKVGFHAYADNASKLDGSPHCCHIEWVARDKAAVERFGIYGLQDLLSFDHRAFWQDRLLLKALDAAILGLKSRNAQDGGRRRLSEADDLDLIEGNLIKRAHGPNTQVILNRLGKGPFRATDALVCIDVSGWLP